MEAPNYYHLRTKLLKEVLEDTHAFVRSFAVYWKKYGCSIMSDFWTDGKGRCLINFLVNCPKGTIFLKSVDASEYVKDANLIVGMIDEVIQQVGEENIVQFITDNGSNYKLAGARLEEKYPKLFWSPCAAHCVNLMLGDVGEKLDRIKSVLVSARSVVVYIYNHVRILNLMRHYTNGNELHRSCVTRFASQFYTLASLDKNMNAIRTMFVSDTWTKSDFATKVEGKNVERIVGKGSFWKNVKFACAILAPLVDVIRLVDTEEKPCMGYIYEAMDRAKEQIKKNIGEDDAKTDEAKKQCFTLRMTVWNIIDRRWDDQLHRPLHAAGLYLNPMIYYKQAECDGSLSIEGNAEIKGGLFKIFDRLVPEYDDNMKLYSEVIYYRDALRSFGEAAAIRSRNIIAPAEWWVTFGSSAPTLQRLAIRVLSQTCSASPCERNWSAFDNIHSKKRNCLMQEKLNQLVYIQYNKKLKRRYEARLSDANNTNPMILKEVDENDDWIIPTNDELRDFVRQGDDLCWSHVEEAMAPSFNEGPSTRSTRQQSNTHSSPFPSFSLLDEDSYDDELEIPFQREGDDVGNALDEDADVDGRED